MKVNVWININDSLLAFHVIVHIMIDGINRSLLTTTFKLLIVVVVELKLIWYCTRFIVFREDEPANVFFLSS